MSLWLKKLNLAMPPSVMDDLRQAAPEQLRVVLTNFLPKSGTTAERTKAIEAALLSPVGQSMRETMAQWIVDEIVPVTRRRFGTR